MGVHITFNRTCDRCGKPFDMQRVSYEAGLPKLVSNPWVLMHGGKQVFSFDDLCPSCEGVVGKLVKRMALDDEKKDDEKNGAGPNTDDLTEPTVNKEEPAAPEAGETQPKAHPF